MDRTVFAVQASFGFQVLHVAQFFHFVFAIHVGSLILIILPVTKIFQSAVNFFDFLEFLHYYLHAFALLDFAFQLFVGEFQCALTRRNRILSF